MTDATDQRQSAAAAAALQLTSTAGRIGKDDPRGSLVSLDGHVIDGGDPRGVDDVEASRPAAVSTLGAT